MTVKIESMPKANILIKRQKYGWTQEQLAEISGVGVRTIQRIENGHPTSLQSLRALAAAFKCDIADIIIETKSLIQEAKSFKDIEVDQKSEDKVYFLPRLRTGKSITDIIGGAEIFQHDNDEPRTKDEVEAIALFVELTNDWGGIWSEIEPGRRISISFDFNNHISDIEKVGFSVFGIRRNVVLNHGGKKIPMEMATVILRRSNDRRIVKGLDNSEILPCIFSDNDEVEL